MWKCPKCNRELKHIDQSHFCEIPKTIDDYIAVQAEEIQPILKQLHIMIADVLLDAQEVISWGMPTFRKERNIIHFAANKKHIGLYPGDLAITHFTKRLLDYKTSKGSIHFQYDKPLPADLIKDIVKWCLDNSGSKISGQ